MKSLRNLPIFLLVLILITQPALQAAAQADTDKYFPQTGFWVRGEFWAFYKALKNADILLGYPISREFTSVDGKTVQYFQKARLEIDTTRSAGERVQLSPLGYDLRKGEDADGQLNINNPMGCKYFSETGYSVCYDFLTFFEANGGVEFFGYPITPFEYHNNLIMQYFQKGRLEWQPWKPEGQKVSVSDLGKTYFLYLKENSAALELEDGGNLQTLLKITTHVFTLKPVTRATDQQTLFIIAQDQVWKPVIKANVTIKITWPDKTVQIISQMTDNYGVVRYDLPVKNQPIGGVVLVEVTVSYSSIEGKASASFRIWY